MLLKKFLFNICVKIIIVKLNKYKFVLILKLYKSINKVEEYVRLF